MCDVLVVLNRTESWPEIGLIAHYRLFFQSVHSYNAIHFPHLRPYLYFVLYFVSPFLQNIKITFVFCCIDTPCKLFCNVQFFYVYSLYIIFLLCNYKIWQVCTSRKDEPSQMHLPIGVSKAALGIYRLYCPECRLADWG